MQEKRFTGFVTVLLTLLCIYRLSFTFMSISVDKKAEVYSKDENSNINFEKKQNYLASIWKNPVYNFLGSNFTYEELKNNELTLGLDLQGGMYVTLEVSICDLLKSLAKNPTDAFNSALSSANQILNEKGEGNLLSIFYEEYKKLDNTPLFQIFGSLDNKTSTITELTDKELLDILTKEIDRALDRCYDIIMTRIDKFGTSQPNIQRITGTNRIQIELPGVTNPDRVRKILQGVAKLGFWEVYSREEFMPYLQKLFEFGQEDTDIKEDIAEFFKLMKNDILMFNVEDIQKISDILNKIQSVGIFPSNLKWSWDAKPKKIGNSEQYFVFIHPLKTNILGRPVLEGDAITSTNVQTDEFGKRTVAIQMSSSGARIWKDLTAKNIGRAVAITLDDKVYSAPIVNSEIPNGHSSIQGNFSLEEAEDLSNILKAGALPAPVKIVEESIVGPTLGKESQGQAMLSMVVTIIIICAFMIAYYARSGMVANCALLLNLLFIFGIFSQLGASLTMAGIAGLVLTIGMSIDANVIIFERIRDELKKNRHIKEAIKEGYKKSFSSIFDSNLTTFLIGVIMYIFGQGPIKGFATTLMIGILTSFFTSVYVTQYMLGIMVRNKVSPQISFYFNWSKSVLNNCNFNFVKNSIKLWFVSLILIISGFTIIIFKSGFNLGVDFTGGRSVVLTFGKYVEPEQFREIVSQALDGFASEVKHYGSTNSLKITTGYLLNESEDVAAPIIKSRLIENVEKSTDFYYSDEVSSTILSNQFIISNTTKVGPSVANSVKNSAINSTLLSFVMIFLYIFLRFRRWELGLGALVALVHDVLMVFAIFGILSIFGLKLEIDQIFLASILTIIGYSINDTVIIFDRYREIVHSSKNNVVDHVNLAINSTLSRTIITSLTTLFAVFILLLFGGESIRSFSVAMFIGVVFATYSSIFVALPLAYKLSKKQ